MDWIEICRDIGREAAAELMRIYHSEQRSVEISVGHWGDRTLVADKASEDIVVRKLRESHVDFTLISEELGEMRIGTRPRYTVIVDPLDGSFNFKVGLDYFAISIAVMDERGDIEAGYVMNVPRGTEYYATKDGAFKDGRRIRTSDRKNTDHVLIECSKGIRPEDMEIFRRALLRTRHVRAPGALALDLCLVADGTFDCFVCSGASRYLDVAAGIHIVEKAGGLISDFHGNEKIREGSVLKTRNLLAAANGDIRTFLLEGKKSE